MNEIMCSVKDAKKMLEHLNDDDMVILTILSKKTFIHTKSKRIKKINGELLIEKADSIAFQNNEIFGRLSLYGVVQEKDIVHNILFAQLEQNTD